MSSDCLNHGDIPQLTGQSIECLICVTADDEPCLFLLKTHQERGWHRFFLDVGVSFWRFFDEFPEDDLMDEDYPWYDMALRHDLRDRFIQDIVVEPYEQGCKIRLLLDQSISLEISTAHWDDQTQLQVIRI